MSNLIISRLIPTFVVDVQRSETEPGTPIIAFERNGDLGTPNQHWTFEPNGLVVNGLGDGLVMAVEGVVVVPGSKVVLKEERDAEPSTLLWDFDGNHIRTQEGEFALSLNSIAEGTPLEIQPLNPDDLGQFWDVVDIG